MKKIFLRVTGLFILSLAIGGCDKLLIGPEPPTDPLAVYDYFVNDFKRTYAVFEARHVDPDTFGLGLRPRISAQTTDQQLFDLIGGLTLTLRDTHVSFGSSRFGQYTYYPGAGRPANTRVNLQKYVVLGPPIGPVEYRQMHESSLGYILITTFMGGLAEITPGFEKIDDAMTTFADKKGLIIDIRGNGGGNTVNSRRIASRFADQRRLYSQESGKNGSGPRDFTPWRDKYIEPDGPRRFTKPVVVLTNRYTASAAEEFLMMMRALPNVRIVGDTTNGIVGQPALRELPNGWQYRATSKRQRFPDGSTAEGIGIIPTVTVWNTTADVAQGRDRMLETAISLLK